MASTTLFAPSVRAVQPAFEYSSETKTVSIYFTLNYNTIDQVKKLRYSLIDPNKSSIDGDNSMIKITEDFTPEQDIVVTKNENTQQITQVTINNTVKWTSNPEDDYPDIPSNNEYYFEINLNSTSFKPLTVNQFYQVQVYLSDKDNPDPAVADDWSLPSTVSLIRPIAPIAAAPESFISIDGQKLRGQISQIRDTSGIETIASYQYNIIDQGTEIEPNDEIVYPSPRITNFLGQRFETTIPYSFAEDKNYKIELTYTTKHGYVPEDPLSIDIEATSWNSVTNLGTLSSKYPKVNIADGAIEFKFDSLTDCTLQRASEYTNYKIWSTVANLTASTINTIIQDIVLEGKGTYKYRLFKKKQGAETKNSKQDLSWSEQDPITHKPKTVNEIEMHYDDIFFSNKNYMFALRYNPKISSFKWVTQDSITNTLGGKYPLVRRNGDQFYKQFSISGTLYLDWPEVTDSYCSITLADNKTMANFFVEEPCSLYLSEAKMAEYNQATLKKKMRDIIAEFLSNGSIKLLRSEEEGLMLVYLSGVSFTPNATSGRRIYDFSATATEICEATEENIAKYLPTRTGASNYFINASKVQ